MKDYFNYKGKVCLVTGGSSGMGRATVELLLELGAEVWNLDINEDSVKGARFIKTNMADKASIDAAFVQLPATIDKAFICAGVSGVTTNYTLTYTINAIAPKYITDTYLMERMAVGGAIVYISSVGALLWEKPEHLAEFKDIMDADGWDGAMAALNAKGQQEVDGRVCYWMSKRSVSYLTMKYSNILGLKKQVRVNAILPGFADTGLRNDFLNGMCGGDEDIAVGGNGFLQRAIQPIELANVMIFMNSDMASFLNGEDVIVDGGQNGWWNAGIGETIYDKKLLDPATRPFQ